MHDTKTWFAVPGAALDEVIGCVTRALGLHADPRWVSKYGWHEHAPCVLVHDGHVVVYLGDAEGKREGEALTAAYPRVLSLRVDETNQWAQLVGYDRSAAAYTIYGAAEDAFVRVRGQPPGGDEIAELLAQDADCEEVPVRIARLLVRLEEDLEDLQPARVVRLLPRPFQRALHGDGAPAITVASGKRALGPLEVETKADWPGLTVMARGPSALLARTGDDFAYAIDTTAWPPRFTPLASVPIEAAAFTPWGTLLAAIPDEEDTRHVLAEMTAPGDREPRWHRLPFEQVALLRDVGAGVLLVPETWTDGDVRPYLLTRDGRLAPVAVPAAGEDERGGSGVLALGGDAYLLQWAGTLYHGRAGVLAPCEGSALDERLDSGCRAPDGSTIAADAAVGLVRIGADGARTPLAIQGLERPHTVVAGPGDAVIVVDAEADVACKLVRPSTGRVVRVAYDALELVWDPEAIYYDAAHDQLVIIAEHVQAEPWGELASGTRGAGPTT